MALIDKTKPTDIALNTDLYELTMAQAFLEAGKESIEACFNVFFRENPFGGGYAIAAGMGQLKELVENFRFEPAALDYLSSLEAPGGGKLFQASFLDYLSHLKLSLDIYSTREGEVVFPREPIVRVQGPLIQCQLLETALLNLVNFQTLVATKAARVVQAAQTRSVSDFGLRRAQGADGGLSVARASYIGGVDSTSNVLAGKIYGIPVFGTHAHSWVMAFPTELEAFRAFAQSSPKNCTLLVDTYEVAKGIENAIRVGKEMEAAGEKLAAVRIDSGDLAKLSRLCRKRLDEEGLAYVKISASNDLDEYTIQSLLSQGAAIDSFGVGTKLATCDPQPSLGGVYKLAALREEKQGSWRPTMKFSEQTFKRTIPGVQEVYRVYDKANRMVGDLITTDQDGIPTYEAKADAQKAAPNAGEVALKAVDVMDSDKTYLLKGSSVKPLLHRIVACGKPLPGAASNLEKARATCKNALASLDAASKRFLNPEIYPVALDPSLARMRSSLVQEELTR